MMQSRGRNPDGFMYDSGVRGFLSRCLLASALAVLCLGAAVVPDAVEPEVVDETSITLGFARADEAGRFSPRFRIGQL